MRIQCRIEHAYQAMIDGSGSSRPHRPRPPRLLRSLLHIQSYGWMGPNRGQVGGTRVTGRRPALLRQQHRPHYAALRRLQPIPTCSRRPRTPRLLRLARPPTTPREGHLGHPLAEQFAMTFSNQLRVLGQSFSEPLVPLPPVPPVPPPPPSGGPHVHGPMSCVPNKPNGP